MPYYDLSLFVGRVDTSSKIRASPSSKTVLASSKPTRCFRRLAAAFLLSHWNRTFIRLSPGVSENHNRLRRDRLASAD